MYLFSNHFIKLKSPAFGVPEESEAWVTGGVDFSRTAGGYCPLGHCPTGTSLCFGENWVYWHLSLAPLMSDLRLQVPVTGVQTKETHV